MDGKQNTRGDSDRGFRFKIGFSEPSGKILVRRTRQGHAPDAVFSGAKAYLALAEVPFSPTQTTMNRARMLPHCRPTMNPRSSAAVRHRDALRW